MITLLCTQVRPWLHSLRVSVNNKLVSLNVHFFKVSFNQTLELPFCLCFIRYFAMSKPKQKIVYWWVSVVQDKRNSSALAIELRLSCTNPSICQVSSCTQHLVSTYMERGKRVRESLGEVKFLYNVTPYTLAQNFMEYFSAIDISIMNSRDTWQMLIRWKLSCQ